MAGSTSPTRKFLMQQPRPMAVRVHVPGEDKPRLLPLGPGLSWAKFADTVDALTPRLIEALDGTGNLLRARNTEIAEAEEEEEEEPDAPELDVLAPQPGDDQQTRLLTRFAGILANAHRHAGDQSLAFMQTSFGELVRIVNMMSQRQASLERTLASYERLVARNAFAGDGGEGDGDGGGPKSGLLEQMIGQFVASGGLNGPGPKANGANGAGHGGAT